MDPMKQSESPDEFGSGNRAIPRARLVPFAQTPRSVRADTTIPAAILVVEDEQIVALELKDRLTWMGHSVVGIVASGEEAIEESRRLHPDLLLTGSSA
jgi:PleD family two-component response regulator